MRNRFVFLTILGIFFLSMPLGAAEPQVDLGAQPTSGTRAALVDLTAKIEEIDYETRWVTLKGPQDNLLKIQVSEDVKNFKKLKKGDVVAVKYYESIAWELLGPKEKAKPKSKTESETVTEGKKPSMVEMKQLNMTATITSISKTPPSVTLSGPEGKLMTFKVMEPKRLEGVKVGDKVDITYSESMAIAVEKAPKK